VNARTIRLRGVEVHNLQHVDLDLPHRSLIVFCGVSGSGKTSLALDTLYAEGQRRYIESFSAYTRQFLQRLEKPAAESIDGIPPAIAVTRTSQSQSSRSTVGTTTETNDYLRLLLARVGDVVCTDCVRLVRRDSPQSAADLLARLPAGVRLMVAFAPSARSGSAAGGNGQAVEGPSASHDISHDEESSRKEQALLFTEQTPASGNDPAALIADLQREGYVRAIDGNSVVQLDSGLAERLPSDISSFNDVEVVVDRLVSGKPASGEGDTDVGGPASNTTARLRDTLETARIAGAGSWIVLVEDVAGVRQALGGAILGRDAAERTIDGRQWLRLAFSERLRCEACGLDYPLPEPRLLSFNSPLGACPRCEGFGNVIEVDMDLVVPEPNKTLREGAVAPWNTPAYAHELEELVALADDYDIPLDVPYHKLTNKQRRLVYEGVPERNFGGLRGFFAWLERRKYKMHLRVYLSRWRSARPCPECRGQRLRPEALAVRLDDKHIADICNMQIDEAIEFFEQIELTPWQRKIGQTMIQQVRARLGYLSDVGVGYLTLDRTLRTISGGEAQRVALTTALGSSLTGMLYVLDEPSAGLHPHDVRRLSDAVSRLHRRGNTVVVVEHEEEIIRAADQVVEIGPGAGQHGGRIVFQGTPAALAHDAESLTGQWLAGLRGASTTSQRRPTQRGSVRLVAARGNNLKNVTVEFPLGVLCLVTGVSGSGKSSLVEHTLYPALGRRLHKQVPKPLEFDEVFGDGQLDDIVLVDQSPIGRSGRSNPVTYIKAFDAVRAVFADTSDARVHNITAGQFSFNAEGGRCEACRGDGYTAVDMQFLADVYMKCDQCNGRRYRREILDVRYRGRNIAEVLDMTAREAFTFFRGHAKVQSRLKRLIDVGLDYLRLGQPAGTLSGGESQRLKLASYLTSVHRGRTLFILDEPTTGLHAVDILQLLDCFDALLDVGHSLIVVEHNLAMMKAADYIIDLGPGAADEGGTVVASGTPEEIARHDRSLTAPYLRDKETSREDASD